MSVKRSKITKVVETVISYACICPICKLKTPLYEEEYENGEVQCEECFKYFKLKD